MTFSHALSIVLILYQFSIQVLSQQLQDSLNSEPPWPNITATCFQALNATAACPGFLQRISVNNQRLSVDELGALCTDTCRNSLTSVRQNILSRCTGQTDIIQYFDGVNYPATFVVDHYIHAYSLACRKDPSTKQFCDPLMTQWLSNTNWTRDMDCHDCILGTQQTLLNSPFDYTEEFAEEFASLTSSCGATQYSFTPPATYALGTQPSETPLPAPSCSQTYTVKAGDTCNSISTTFNVSTNAIVLGNGLLSDCSNLAAVGTICVPQACNIYQIQSGDTCDSIIAARANGVSGSQFLAWNSNINALCSNLGTIRRTYICLSPPGGALIASTPTVNIPMTQPTTAAPRPTNSFPESNGNCGKWYNITSGDTCDGVSIANSISSKDFYFLNPEIDARCSNLVLGVSYCVKAVGDIHTYSGYPVTTNFITLTSNTFATTTSSAQVKLPLPSRTATSLLPHASGTAQNCFAYKNYREIPAIVDQSQSTELALYTSFINSCDYTTSTWSVALEDMIAWNPSLDRNNCTMKPGFSYCVLKDENYKPNVTNPYISLCMSVVDPAKIPQGTDSTCSCFTEINGEDWPDFAEDCEGLVEQTGLDVSNIAKWNPWVGTDCDSGLYKDLASGDTRAVCIGIGGKKPIFTSSASTMAPTRTMSTPITPTGSATHGPTQPDIAADCTQFYTVVDGDTCGAILTTYGLSLAQFYAWNPAVGPDCAGMWLTYAYCVAAPTRSFSSANPLATNGPLRSGTPTTCAKYYTPRDGESCQNVLDVNKLTIAQMYKWNTDIGSGCENLWPGYGLCVAGGPA